jgi:hypothetical protein
LTTSFTVTVLQGPIPSTVSVCSTDCYSSQNTSVTVPSTDVWFWPTNTTNSYSVNVYTPEITNTSAAVIVLITINNNGGGATTTTSSSSSTASVHPSLSSSTGSLYLSSSGSISSCSDNCLTCSNRSVCTMCAPFYYLLSIGGGASCVSTCGSGYVAQSMSLLGVNVGVCVGITITNSTTSEVNGTLVVTPGINNIILTNIYVINIQHLPPVEKYVSHDNIFPFPFPHE